MANITRQEAFTRWLCRQQGVLPPSALRYTLEALVPFTRANMKLSWKPGAFFAELDKIKDGRYAYATVKKAYFEAKRRGYIVIDDHGSPRLSREAQQLLRPYQPKRLKGASVMVIFDIPVAENYKRRWFRLLLRELKFEQVQKSVWMSKVDCFAVLSAGILEQKIEKYVQVFEARPID